MPENSTTSAPTPCPLNQIRQTLEEDIVLGLLAPGMRLLEDECMLRFGAKRHVVRDAFVQLEAAGLIERRRNIGALVKSFEPQEIGQLYEMRLLLEAQAMQQLDLPIAEQELAAIAAAQAEHDAAVAAADPRRIFHANHAFHARIFALTPNPFLVQSIEYFARRTHAIRFGTLLSREHQMQAQREHHAIIEALVSGDRARLLRLSHDHILTPRDHYLRLRHPHFPVPTAAPPA